MKPYYDEAGIAIFHGDVREVLPALAPASFDCLMTDPPYGIGYERMNGADRSGPVQWEAIAGDEAVSGDWLKLAFPLLADGSAVYLCTRWDVEPQWRDELASAGFDVKQRLIWHSGLHGKGDLKGTWADTCEDVIFASKGRHILNHRWSMLLDVGCIPTWEIRYHPHQKPIGLSGRLIGNSTSRGKSVLVPFCGSGSELIGAKGAGCRAVGIELEERYCEVAARRLAQGVLFGLEVPA